MSAVSRVSALILGLSLIVGLSALGYLGGNYAIAVKEYERTVTVRGLAEQEESADLVIWPIQFTETGNDLDGIYQGLDNSANRIREFLMENGVADNEINLSPPAITDRYAQLYGDSSRAEFRYTASQTVTVYSSQIETVRDLMTSLSELGREGIVLTGADYGRQPEFLFTRLNDIKPAMIEQATREARAAAVKFADDSQSQLGKIKQASQGQFSISDRDRNNPHIKNVRVVVTVEYYLAD